MLEVVSCADGLLLAQINLGKIPVSPTGNVPYVIKSRKGARGVKISVDSGGSVVVTKSPSVSGLYVEMLVKGKAGWIIQQIEKMKMRPKKLLAHHSTKEYKMHKDAAYTLAENRVEHFNKFYGFDVKKIYIRNQKTRWGSCSSRGTLSFNYKIFFLPEDLCDYIIVHELCHLGEMNHSARFWAKVAEQIPDYKNRRREIRRY